MAAIRYENARPAERGEDDGIGAIGSIAIALPISLLLWLVPISAWLLLK